MYWIIFKKKNPHLKRWARTCNMIIYTDPPMLSSNSYLSNNSVKRHQTRSYIKINLILSSIYIYQLSHTLPLMNIHDMTSLPQLTLEDHAKNPHCQSAPMNYGSSCFRKTHKYLDCHSKHPPMSRSFRQTTQYRNNLRKLIKFKFLG